MSENYGGIIDELEIALREAESEEANERLSGDIAKEHAATGRLVGLGIAIEIVEAYE